jgi:hypothetical protein
MNRRGFIGTAALAAAAGPSLLTLEGCSFGSVMANLAKYLPIALQAVAGVAAIVAPGAGTAIAALIGMINTAFGALQAAVNTYNSAAAADKATTLEKVLVALDAVQGQLAATIKALGVATSPAIQGAEAALLLVTTTLASIEATLAPQAPPVVASTHAAHAQAASVGSVTVNGITLPVTGKPGDFKTTFNKIMTDAGRPDLVLK